MLLVWFADNSRVEEHVVHVCSIYPLIRLQGSALKHALQPPLLASTHSASPSDKEAILALISFHSARPYLASGLCDRESNGSNANHTELLSRDMRTYSSHIIKLPMTCLVSD